MVMYMRVRVLVLNTEHFGIFKLLCQKCYNENGNVNFDIIPRFLKRDGCTSGRTSVNNTVPRLSTGTCSRTLNLPH